MLKWCLFVQWFKYYDVYLNQTYCSSLKDITWEMKLKLKSECCTFLFMFLFRFFVLGYSEGQYTSTLNVSPRNPQGAPPTSLFHPPIHLPIFSFSEHTFIEGLSHATGWHIRKGYICEPADLAFDLKEVGLKPCTSSILWGGSSFTSHEKGAWWRGRI